MARCNPVLEGVEDEELVNISDSSELYWYSKPASGPAKVKRHTRERERRIVLATHSRRMVEAGMWTYADYEYSVSPVTNQRKDWTLIGGARGMIDPVTGVIQLVSKPAIADVIGAQQMLQRMFELGVKIESAPRGNPRPDHVREKIQKEAHGVFSLSWDEPSDEKSSIAGHRWETSKYLNLATHHVGGRRAGEWQFVKMERLIGRRGAFQYKNLVGMTGTIDLKTGVMQVDPEHLRGRPSMSAVLEVEQMLRRMIELGVAR